MRAKNYRKRTFDDADEKQSLKNDDEQQQRKLVLEEVKFLQKQREKRSGIPALPTAAQIKVAISAAGGLVPKKVSEKSKADGEKDELVLQDTFALETAIMEEDPNMTRYVEQELAKRRGKKMDEEDHTRTS